MVEFKSERLLPLQAAVAAVNKELESLADEFGNTIEIRPHGNFGDGNPSISIDIRTGLFIVQ